MPDLEDELELEKIKIEFATLKTKFSAIYEKIKYYLYAVGVVIPVILIIFKAYLSAFIVWLLFFPSVKDIYNILKKS